MVRIPSVEVDLSVTHICDSDFYHLLISGVGLNIATDILCESDGCHCKRPAIC